jgi:pimeloyl-ACP methyl ester carboxylesterase
MIGSSYGGAVLHEFVRLGVWTGPTVYLAPAFMLQTELGHFINDYVASTTHPTVIIHGTPDDIVPLQHSLAFVSANPQTLLIAGPWSHRLGEILVDGTLEYAIAQALAPVSTIQQADNA